MCEQNQLNNQTKNKCMKFFKSKFMRIMRLTIIIITLALMQVSAAGLAQKVSLSFKNVPLEQVLLAVKQQTAYNFVYTEDVIAKAKKVSINIKDAYLKDTLSQCFENQPLSFTIEQSTIVIKEKEPSFLERVVATLTAIDVTGRVVDAEGKPLPGASVKVQRSGKSVSTNAKGEFVFRGVEDGAVLVVSFIGYVSKELKASADMGNIALVLSDNILDQVQVIAYGTTSRRLSTGNVSTVKAEDIAKQPVSNPLLALQGRVPGLVVTQANGIPGGGVTVRIQGQNSINSGNDPLYVIDGVPYISQLLPGLNDILGNSGGRSVLNGGLSSATSGNPLSYLNPSDIERIDVLKDADATAIYGSRAANGAILITTKKGRSGETKVVLNLQSGFGHITRKLDLLNTQQYLEMRKEAYFINDKSTISSNDYLRSYDFNGLWDTTRYTDWQKELIGGSANYTDAQASVSGGNNYIQFLIGTGFNKQGTVFPGNFTDQKGSIHFSINSISSNQRFKLILSGNYLIDNNKLPGIDLTSKSLSLAPNAPSIFNPDGTLNWMPDDTGTSSWGNPLAEVMYVKQNIKTNNLVSNSIISYKIIHGLEIASSFGYTNMQVNSNITYPLNFNRPEDRPYAVRFAGYVNNNVNSWIIEPQLNYKKNIGKAKLSALLGMTIQQTNSNSLNLGGSGFNSDAAMEDIHSATSVTANSNIAFVYRYNAAFGRLNYNWDDKYVLNFTVRRDGSSRFGSQNRFHNFGAIGAAWIFTRGNFMKAIPFLSFGKISASFGTTGSDQIGEYQYLSLYSSAQGVPYQGIQTITPKNLANPFLQWEETRKTTFGLDLGFLKDRLLFIGNYNVNRSSNQLLSYLLPTLTGFSSSTTNFPAIVQNTSIELSISIKNLKTKKFNWNSSINLTVPKNKLVSFPNLVSSSYAKSLIVGQPISIKKVYTLFRVDPATGLYQFTDRNGNPTSNPNSIYSTNSDQNALMNVDQKLYGGIQNNFSYKAFSLDILFQFVKQIGPNYYFGNLPGSRNSNQPKWVLDRWRKPDDISSHQQFSYSYNGDLYPAFNAASNSDAANSDASYIRLKNISFSYQLPHDWLSKIKVRNVKLYIQGQNLFTITPYMGLDPETMSLGSLPPLRVLTMGAQIEL
jgi:TonB-linked SusC/RagA family outer membrane protein